MMLRAGVAVALGAGAGACLWRWARRRCTAALHPALVDPRSGETLSKAAVFKLRRTLFCAAQSVSYANSDPLLAMSGSEHWLFDEQGRVYLDTRNNVAHVGHANKNVAAAVCAQVATLNTNMRYIHPTVCLLARALLATLPLPLSDGTVFFVNSGSEANDLALRLARAHTGRIGTVVLEYGYHGHTIATLGISPYKFASKRAHPTARQPDWVLTAPAPDLFRGPHRGDDAGERYSDYVRDACAGLERRASLRGDPSLAVGAFLVESGMSVAGVIVPPSGYLRRCYAAVRAAGGVCIADEVQTGLGRCGNGGWWAFESGPSGNARKPTAPDIVTVGKPLGNGMPIAAVVCTREIAQSFAAGPEYFNTFGGNPVCAAAALAMLSELERLGLRARATATGAELRAALGMLASAPHGLLIGDVRGEGLFVGLDFVTDRETRAPATAEASYLCSRLKERHRILTSLDGPSDNVLVIKPPLTFDSEAVRMLVSALDEELRALALVSPDELQRRGHTPT
ncbi:pyridoxal phosphate-dependent transferase [Pavlovales sp. CCMP2436]|nr:pyridoxal phosphate-dependent transferase [Pavlovales sp. CCMP2436]